MISRKQSRELRGPLAVRAIEACLLAMESGAVSSRQVRDVERCEPCQEMDGAARFLDHADSVIRVMACRVLVKWAPEKVIDAIRKEKDRSALLVMMKVIGDAKYKEIENLTFLLRDDDEMLVELALQLFVQVERSDLLLGLAVGGDDQTAERVKRYLNEQGFLK